MLSSSLQITARYFEFVAYSTGAESIIICDSVNRRPQAHAKIIPGLQDKSIISVAQGHNHYAARTTDGKVYTWGRSFDGALGLGGVGQYEERVETPTQVKFDGKELFCIAITAGREHTAALVLDL